MKLSNVQRVRVIGQFEEGATTAHIALAIWSIREESLWFVSEIRPHTAP